jgi:hypothetical protein
MFVYYSSSWLVAGFDFTHVINQLTQIPGFFSEILIYLLFIIFLEMLLRVLDFFFDLLGLEPPEPKEEE